MDDPTLEVRVRRDERFPDGEAMTAETVKRAFDEQVRWTAPHPPGTHLNIDRRTRCEVTGPLTVRFLLPEVDGLVLGKLRATHLISSAFWRKLGFGHLRHLSGEGHW
ncbi:MAG: hypothetical protein M3P53_10290 [Actinomycetota bacterium]|nr:hypothetical protein [Actinomycetota bacterium]